MVTAQRKSSGIHHLKVAADDLIESNAGVAGCSRVFSRICAVNPVHLGRLEHDLSADFRAPQSSRRVGGEKRVARSGCKNNDFAFFQVLQSFGPDIGLDNALNADGRHHPGREAGLVHGVSECQSIHHSRQHTHVVGGRPVHADRAARNATKDVAPADDDSHLHTQARHLCNLFDHPHNGGAVDAECIVAHQGFAGEFEQDPLVGWHVSPVCGNCREF